MPFPKTGEPMPKVPKILDAMDEQSEAAAIDAEQQQAAAADTDLREACRQYYWPQWNVPGSPVRKLQNELYALGQISRDRILKANGCWSQREFEGNRQSMAANGTNFVKGSLEADSTWKMNTIGDRPPYQYLEG